MQARDLRAYKYFLTLAQELHFGRAAELSCITQPALSQQIARLEESLGVKLLLRDHRKVTLTRAGEVLRDGTHQIFQLLEETTRRAREAGGLDDFRLSIGLVEYANVGVLPGALARLQPGYPELKLIRHDINADMQIAALQRAQIDIGFGCANRDLLGLVPADGSVRSQRLLSAGWRVLLRDSHPLAHAEQLTLKDLCGQRLIMHARELHPSLYDWIHLEWQRAGSRPHVVYETSAVQAGLQMAQSGLGCMMLAGFVQYTELPGLRSVPLAGLDPVAWHIFWRAGETRRLVLDFLERVQEEAAVCFNP
jgi:DNA-binding transcriptional LysR family regulator